MQRIKHRARSAGVVAIAATLLVVLLPTAALAVTPKQMQNIGSGKCLAVAGGSFNNNAVLVQYNCDGDPTRKWNLFLTADGSEALIANGATGKCATPGGQGSNTNGWHLVQYNCDSDSHRYWEVISTRSNGTQAQWRNVGSGFCMSIDGNSTANNAIVVQVTCNSNSNFQYWRLI